MKVNAKNGKVTLTALEYAHLNGVAIEQAKQVAIDFTAAIKRKFGEPVALEVAQMVARLRR